VQARQTRPLATGLLAVILAVSAGLAACSGHAGQRGAAGGTDGAGAARPDGAESVAGRPPGAGPTTSAAAPAARPPATTAPRAAASTANRLAAELTRTETAIRDPATPAGQLGALGRAQQLAYRALARDLALLAKVLPLVPAGLRPVVQANALAGAELRKLSRPGPVLPRWRIVAPAPAAELLTAYHMAAAKTGVSWAYLAAVHLVETRLGRIQGDSPAGARGPMQFLPSTWRRYGAGGDITSTEDAVLAAARMLRANGAPSDMAAALYAYNHSALYVRAVTAYATQMQANRRAFLGYYHWQVFYGDTLLPEGYPDRKR
jgi:membrane-bound lytic murein transglycosylase B